MATSEALRVDIGCGDRKAAGFIGVDTSDCPGVDIVCDLNGRFPFETGTVDHLRAHDVVEHLVDRLHTMNEIWRVCRHGATVDIRVPSTDGRGAFQDPTHVSFWNANSFLYYSEDHPAYLTLCRRYGFRGGFRIRALVSETSPDQVVHVHVVLTAVKPEPEALAAPAPPPPAPPLPLSTTGPATSPRHELALRLARIATPDELDAFGRSPADVAAWRALAMADGPPPPLTPAEAGLWDALAARLAGGIDSSALAACQLAALVLKPAFRLPPRFNLPLIPAGLMESAIGALCGAPEFFTGAGDVRDYRAFLESWLGYVHGLLSDARNRDALSPQAVNALLGHMKFQPLYGSDGNLKPLYTLRGKILDQGLRRLGHAVDHTPAPRAAGARPHLGVVFDTVTENPDAENPEMAYSVALLRHVPGDFDVTVYAVTPGGGMGPPGADPRIRFVALPPDMGAQVDRIRGDRVDVLYFATSLTASNTAAVFLAAHRLAPVQVASVASAATTGLGNVDVFVSADPLETDGFPQSHYTEELVKLPGVAPGFGPLPPAGATPEAKPAAPGAVVFASTASMTALTPELLDVFAGILTRCPGSTLALLPFGPHGTAPSCPKQAFAAHCAGIMAAHGLAPARLRVIDTTGSARVDIRNALRRFDVYLDSFPFSAAAPVIEPLELAIPMVTLAGASMRANGGASRLRGLGLADLVARDSADYVERACRLALDHDHRAATSARIAHAMAAPPAFLDAPGYARRVYDLFRGLMRA
jgi:SAM-dependent methyltransferase